MKTLFVAAFTALLAVPAFALTTTPDCLKTHDISATLKTLDISDADVSSISQDKGGEKGDKTLDNVAKYCDPDAVKTFIATRKFIREFKKNSSTPTPSGYYDAKLLTKSESDFVKCKLREDFGTLTPPKKSACPMPA